MLKTGKDWDEFGKLSASLGKKKEAQFLRLREQRGIKGGDNSIIAVSWLKKKQPILSFYGNEGAAFTTFRSLARPGHPHARRITLMVNHRDSSVANRCLRGFINMSGIDTIFESARVCAQTPNHLEGCPQLD